MKRTNKKITRLTVKTGIKAGILMTNHNRTLVCKSNATRPVRRNLKVKTGIKAGIIHTPMANHNQTLVRK